MGSFLGVYGGWRSQRIGVFFRGRKKFQTKYARFVTDHMASTCKRCLGEMKGRRRDALFCSSACRQGAYRDRVENTPIAGPHPVMSDDEIDEALLAFNASQLSATTARIASATRKRAN